MDTALAEFHESRKIFVELGIRLDFNLPRQHSARHWTKLIREFGAPNGLCSSITESKHIKAVKQPWRRSSRYRALQQMLYINQRLDKLSAARVDFTRRGMLEPPKRSRQSVTADKAGRPLSPARYTAQHLLFYSVAAHSLTLAALDNDGGPVEGHGILAEVQLAPTLSRECSLLFPIEASTKTVLQTAKSQLMFSQTKSPRTTSLTFYATFFSINSTRKQPLRLRTSFQPSARRSQCTPQRLLFSMRQVTYAGLRVSQASVYAQFPPGKVAPAATIVCLSRRIGMRQAC